MSEGFVAHFEKRFRDGPTIRCELSCATNRFSITTLFGPSGGGKSTVLRCLAGLEKPEQGRITFGKQTWFDAERRICVRPQVRAIGYLFQDYALFPHLSVAGNVGYGLAKGERTRQLPAMLSRFGLSEFTDRKPHQISGGQQQRVALARVLARKPKLLLLDEPLSALDAVVRKRTRAELLKSLREFQIPVLMVTHDFEEAEEMSDRIVILHEGRILQQGTPEEIRERPVSSIVRELVE